MYCARGYSQALVLILSATSLVSLKAADKSGVSPQAISLPSGPGSVEGLGEKFEPQLNSGTFSYQIPLKLPPVRGGAPFLALTYSSGSGNGVLGQGWTLGIPCVRRQTDKGLPLYTNTDLFYDENAAELVHLADNSYRQKIEGLFIRYQQTNDGWVANMPNGTVLSFGSSKQSRLDWTTNGTFSWMIDSSQDPNGNRVEYSYLQHSQQIYPNEVRYGVHVTQPSSFFSVQFSYSTNRPDPFVDCRPRFASTNRFLLDHITVYFGSRRIREWQFGYDTNAPVSLLTSVTMFGDDHSTTDASAKANVDYLPPTRFSYTPYLITTQVQVMTISFDPGEQNFAFGGEDGGGTGNYAEFVDINHDGLPDILVNNSSLGTWRSLLNPGPLTNFWPLSQVITNAPVGVGLGQSSTRLVDLRGDGRSKLMVSQDGSDPDGSTAFYYYDFLSPTTLGEAQPYYTSNGITLGQTEVQFVDMDDDKAMDLVRINSGFLEALYSRTGPTNQYLTSTEPWGFDFAQGWQVADINGDRLQDFVYLNMSSGEVDVSLNLGWGWFAAPYAMSGGPTAADIQGSGTSGPRFVDLNQDGLADLVIVENGDIRIWLNQNGTSWSAPMVIAGTPAYQSGQTIVRFADINGNGSTDIIWHSGQDPFFQYVDLFPSGKAFLLNHSVTTLGRSLDIAYKTSTDYMAQSAGTSNQWTVVAPFSVPVISQIVESDGLGSSYTNQFSYRNGYYDAFEHQFRGFEEATKIELGDESQGAPTLVTRYQFDTGATNEAMKGKPLRVEADLLSGGVFYRQTNTWFPRPLNLPTAQGEGRTVTFAFKREELIEEVELGPETSAVILEKAFEYDNYGNQTFAADYGRVENGNRAAWNDERLFVRHYSAEYPTGTNLWLLDRLVEQDTEDVNSNIVARQQIFYDDPSFSGNNLGTVSIGNPTLVRDWVNISSNTYRATTRREYDLFGNVFGVYDPLGAPGQPSVGHYRQIAFDSQIHTHPVTETIFTGNPDATAAGSSNPSLFMQANYDVGLGVMTSATDFNTNTTLFSFDTFGRISSITKPYDSTNLPTALFSYELQVPFSAGEIINYIQSDLREVAGQLGIFSSRSFFDGMGRKVMTRTQSETNGVVVVNDATLFNQRRVAWRTFLPYFEMGTLGFNPINQSGAYVESSYDALGRETIKSQPPTPPKTYRAFSLTTYGPLTRLVQDEEQTQTSSPHFGAGMFYVEDGLRGQDGHGRLREVEEIVHLSDMGQLTPGTNAWLTQYRYDTLDNFLGYTDSQGNQKFFQYDALSRKEFMNDPDRGIMRWDYDLASNVTNTLDAKGQVIVYTYDGVNRLQTENYLDDKSKPPWRSSTSALGLADSVVYHYDVPRPYVDNGDGTSSTAVNTFGKLAWVEDLSGEEHTGYDARGRVAYTIKRLPDLQFLYATNSGIGQPLISYRTSFAYDSLDRTTSLVYPDNDAISYLYNGRNLLQSIQGGVNGLTRAGAVIENISYQASAQLGSIQYGNGILTQYAYDPRLRLSSITTAPQANAAAPLIAFGYAFDDASNMKTIYDNRPVSVVAAGDPRRNTQVFVYDDLYRITFAGYALGPPSDTNVNSGSINYNYDRIGNMLAQTSTISDTDPLTGLAISNLGQMSSGGSAGSANRMGRAHGDPPGPHALTQIQSTSSQLRIFPYDAIGNMTLIDGLTNTWDFKDRLVEVQNSQMSAQYLYDYTDRRVGKNVTYAPDTTNSSLTTLYINKYFEVRDNDQPTKFVWNADTRVARVIGSLSHNQRIQRLRLWPGMNLVSVAVNGATLPADTNLVAAYLWNPTNLSWQIPGTSLAAGSVLWLQSSTNCTLALVGTYTDPLPYNVTNGPNFLPGTGLEALALSNLSDQFSTNRWYYNAKDHAWQTLVAVSFNSLNPLRVQLSPGDVFIVRANATGQMTASAQTFRLRYYHQDHLGSSSITTDYRGHLGEETAFSPFGQERQVYQPGGINEPFKFCQKEHDNETRLTYFDARCYSSLLSRFTKADPILFGPAFCEARSPQKLNAYSYCANMPIKNIDPTGMEGEDICSSVEFTGKCVDGPLEDQPAPEPGPTPSPQPSPGATSSQSEGVSLETTLDQACKTFSSFNNSFGHAVDAYSLTGSTLESIEHVSKTFNVGEYACTGMEGFMNGGASEAANRIGAAVVGDAAKDAFLAGCAAGVPGAAAAGAEAGLVCGPLAPVCSSVGATVGAVGWGAACLYGGENVKQAASEAYLSSLHAVSPSSPSPQPTKSLTPGLE